MLNYDINKLILVRQSIYPYEYINDWKKFNETLLSEKDFYSHLNMEDITDADHTHTKGFCKEFKGEFYDLYVQSDTFLLADVFESFRNMCLKIFFLHQD